MNKKNISKFMRRTLRSAFRQRKKERRKLGKKTVPLSPVVVLLAPEKENRPSTVHYMYLEPGSVHQIAVDGW